MIKAKVNSESNLIPDLAPLLDLIFIVMVFLLLTTNISIQTLEIDIPKTKDDEALQEQQKDVITVNITTGENPWAIDEKTYSDFEIFQQNLLSTVDDNKSKSIIIGVDRKTKVELMMKLLAFLQKNKLKTAEIIMEKE